MNSSRLVELEKESVKEQKMIIFSPGPANISQRVRTALSLPDICHRDEEFSQLLKETKGLLKKALHIHDDSSEVVLFSGSGTLAMESLIVSLSGWGQSLLIISNGIYGERAADIAKTYGVKTEELTFDWGEPPDLDLVEEEIKKAHVGGIYLVHHETTTGLLNPLKEISILGKKYDKLVLADTISSIAGEELELDWGLDGILGSANKCLRGVPGISFAIVSQNFIEIARGRTRRSYYSDLITHLERERNNETPFTPPIHTLFAFREALKETIEEGLEKRIAHYKHISRFLRQGLKDLGLKLFLPERLYSNTMTSVYLPQGITYQELHDRIKEKGFVIYNAQGRLKGKLFMLGVVGLINGNDVADFLTALGEVLKEKR